MQSPNLMVLSTENQKPAGTNPAGFRILQHRRAGAYRIPAARRWPFTCTRTTSTAPPPILFTLSAKS